MLQIFRRVQANRDEGYASYIKHRTGDDLLAPAIVTPRIKPPFLRRLGQKIKKLNIDRLKTKALRLRLKLARKMVPYSIRNEVFVSTDIGERHKWAYDRYSLNKLLESCGFKDIRIMAYNESLIPNFNNYLLDINEDGSAYKGVSSLYMECRK